MIGIETTELLTEDSHPMWAAIVDGLDDSLLLADAGQDPKWSTYGGSSTSKSCC